MKGWTIACWGILYLFGSLAGFSLFKAINRDEPVIGWIFLFLSCTAQAIDVVVRLWQERKP